MDSKERRDRPEQNSDGEIEITPEMIEMGSKEVLEYSRRFDNEKDVAESVFRVMLEKWLSLRKDRLAAELDNAAIEFKEQSPEYE